MEAYAISVEPWNYWHSAAQLDINHILQSWYNLGCTQQVVDLIQIPLYINKNTYSDTASNTELNDYILTGSDKKQLNKDIVDELLKNANNMRKLVSLNDYVNKVEVKPRRNLIPARDLKLSQVFNWVSMKNHFPKAKLIPTYDLKI